MQYLTSSGLLSLLAALANPHRLQILAALVDAPNYVSQLAREMGISRPLLIIHLRRLEDAGLVSSQLRLSADGKAMRYYQVSKFDLRLTPQLISNLARDSGPFDDEASR